MTMNTPGAGAVMSLDLCITEKHEVAEGVVALTLAHPDGKRLPDWTPGSHVDVVLPGGLVRQYSLCGDRWDAHRYRIGVLREQSSRGGSELIHDTLTVGDTVSIGGPRNNFLLAPAPRYLFIAGGIGITPLLPMIYQAEMIGADWRLLYGGRTRQSMAFVDELSSYGDRVVLCPEDEYGRLDLPAWLSAVTEDTTVYCCGPSSLLDAVNAYCAAWPSGMLRTERFLPKDQGAPVRDDPFEVALTRSGLSLTVQPHQSVLEVIGTAGVHVLSSCRQGICGTCETTVLEGEPDHRDSILDDVERESGGCMFPCVSRACSDRLVLDL